MENSKTKKTVLAMCEGGIMIALSLALSYLDIPLGAQGGSVDLVMVPIMIFALRHGLWRGVTVGLAFGTLKYFLSNGFAISWESIVFDYSVAYAAVGLTALVLFLCKDGKVTAGKAALGAFIGGMVRFAVHYLSGVTVYAQWMPEEFLGLPMSTPLIYSFLYNGLYMIPNIIAAVIVVPLLVTALKKAKI